MSPLRWDVLAVAFLLALPLLAMGLRGDLSTDEVLTRLPWCLAGGWAAVALLRYAGTPRHPARPDPLAARRDADADAPAETEPSPAN